MTFLNSGDLADDYYLDLQLLIAKPTGGDWDVSWTLPAEYNDCVGVTYAIKLNGVDRDTITDTTHNIPSIDLTQCAENTVEIYPTISGKTGLPNTKTETTSKLLTNLPLQVFSYWKNEQLESMARSTVDHPQSANPCNVPYVCTW